MRSLSPEAYSKAVLRIHELATADRTCWSDGIRQVGRLLGAEKALLFSPTPEAADLPGAVVELDPDTLSDYAAHWHQYDEWTRGGHRLRYFDRNRIILGEEVVPHKQFLGSAVYNECLRKEGIGRLMAGVIVTSPSSGPIPLTVCSFYRAARQEQFSRQTQDTYRLLLPHFVQAMETFLRLRDTSAAAFLAGTAIEQIGATLLVLDDARRVVYLSDAAEKELRSPSVLTVRRGKVFAAGTYENAAALERVLEAAKQGRTSSAGLTGKSNMPELRITGVPIPDPIREQLTYLKPSILLLIERIVFDVRSAAAGMRTRYRLTQGEARVLQKIIEGWSLKESARELEISVNTVHTHVKRILAKTGMTSQRQLLAMMLAGATEKRC